MYARWLGMGLGAALAWAAGCGGTVVVDHEGAGGSGGTATTGPGGPTTTTGPGGEPPTLCESLCALSDQLGCGAESGCVSECLELYGMSSGCTAQLDAYLGCVLTNATSCDFNTPACNDPLAAYNQCMGGSTCGPHLCYDDGASCGCEGFCNGLNVSVKCEPGQWGQVDCTCQAENTIVAICQQDVAICDLLGGCCAKYLYDQ